MFNFVWTDNFILGNNIPLYTKIILQLILAKPKSGGTNHMRIIPQ